MAGTHQVVFRGQLRSGVDPADVYQRVAELFRSSPQAVAARLTRPPVVIRAGLDLDAARAMSHLMDRAGALCHVETMPEVPPPGQPAPGSLQTTPDVSVPPSPGPELEAAEALQARFEELLAERSKGTGYAAEQKAGAVAALVGMVLAILVGYSTRWYWGLAALLVAIGVAIKVFDNPGKARLVARLVFRDLARHPMHGQVGFWAAMRRWISKVSREDPTLGRHLESEWAKAVPPAQAAAVEQAVGGLEKLEERWKARKAAEEGEALLDPGKEDRLALRAAEPAACKAVPGQQLRLIPAAPIGIRDLSHFAVSPAFVVAYLGGIWKFPRDCVQAVTVRPASDGISVDAVTSRLHGHLSGLEPVRVQVDFNLVFSFGIGGAARGVYGLSFEVLPDTWKEVEAAWTAFAQAPFPSGPCCPGCGARTLVEKSVPVMAGLGMERPSTLASCRSCNSEVRFLPEIGTFVRSPGGQG